MLRRILKLGGKLLGIFLLFVMLGAGAVFYFPGIVVNDATLPWAARALKAYSVPLTWKAGHWNAYATSIWKRTLRLELESPCYVSADPYLRACFPRVELEVAFDIFKRSYELKKLHAPEGKVQAEGKASADTQPAEPTDPASVIATMHAVLRSIASADVKIGTTELAYTEKDRSLKAQVSVQGSDGSSVSLVTEGKWIQKRLATPARLSLSLEPVKEEIRYRLSGYWGAEKDRITANAAGQLTETTLQGELSGEMRHPTAGIAAAGVKRCRYGWKNATPPTLEVECPVAVSLTQGDPLPLEAVLGAKTTSDAKLPLTLNASLKVEKFESLAGRLASTGWAIPAPFNPLRGTVTLDAKAASDFTFDRLEATFTARSDLHSDSQTLKLTMEGKVDARPLLATAHLTADLLLNEATLSLPRLDPLHLPRLFPDSQIVYPETAMEKKKASSFTYRVAIRTPMGRPLRLLANQYGATIPVALQLVQSSDSGLTGTIHLPTFPVQFLRRNAEVRNVDLEFPPEGAAELNARVLFHYTDYDLTLEAFGKLDSPRYTLTSQPPLPENSAWSLLLFGRPLEQLTPGQGDSVANARAAVASGAVSALSMYLLASTPIESVAYDPNKGRFAATVRLVEGTSLHVEGQKEGVSSVGLRKRLGRDWVLNTYVEQVSPMEPRRSVSTLLEWSRTY